MVNLNINLTGTTVTTKDRSYLMVKKLGQGTFGAVYKAVSKGKEYAMKIMADQEDFLKEAAATRELSAQPSCAPYVTCLYDTDDNIRIPAIGTVRVLVTELMSGDLNSLIKPYRNVGIPPELLYHATMQLLKGIDYIHRSGLAHRDIKPGNILYSEGGRVIKYGDLGGSCKFTATPARVSDIPKCSSYGTPLYSSPEVNRTFWMPSTLEASQAGDIWSVGVVIYELAFGRLPFTDSFIRRYNDAEAVGDQWKSAFKVMAGMTESDMLSMDYTHDDGVYYHLAITNLLKKMLQIDPKKRVTSSEALAWYKAAISPCPDHPSISYGTLVKTVFNPKNPFVKEFLDKKGVKNISDHGMVNLCGLYSEFLSYTKRKLDEEERILQ